MTVLAYFQAKAPKGEIEELAVAARYREEYDNATASSKADILAELISRVQGPEGPMPEGPIANECAEALT